MLEAFKVLWNLPYWRDHPKYLTKLVAYVLTLNHINM